MYYFSFIKATYADWNVLKKVRGVENWAAFHKPTAQVTALCDGGLSPGAQMFDSRLSPNSQSTVVPAVSVPSRQVVLRSRAHERGGVAARGNTWPGPRVWAPGSRDGPGSGCLVSGGWGWLGLPAEAGTGGLVGCCTEVRTRAGVGTQAVSPRADGLGLAAGGSLLLDPSRLAPGLAPTGLGCES